jgi:L-ribulose-5-phosphate 3-epimerase
MGVAGIAGYAVARSGFASVQPLVGICDWNLGPPCDPEQIPKASEAGLSGIQVSIGTRPDSLPLRDRSVRARYVELGKRYGITFHSVAAGSILNRIPLKSEPQSALFVADAIEAAAALGASNVLLAFFGNGDLRLEDSTGQLRNLSQNRFSSYELDRAGVTKVVETLRQLVPRAEDSGVVLGLENTLTAEQNLEIIDRVGSETVQIYYDVGNSTHYGYDVPGELRLIGRKRICEIHLKDWKTPLLGQGGGEVDFPGVAEACRQIGYERWYVLETAGREDRFLQDTKSNVDFVAATF